jgi:hypothetical protein
VERRWILAPPEEAFVDRPLGVGGGKFRDLPFRAPGRDLEIASIGQWEEI